MTTKKELLAAIEAKTIEVVKSYTELLALIAQLKSLELLEQAEQAKKEQERKEQLEMANRQLDTIESVEDLVKAQLEAEALKSFQRQLLKQEHNEKCKQSTAEFEARKIANPVLNYTKKEVRGNKVETYTWETHTGGDCEMKVIIKYDKIEEYTYGSKTATWVRTGNYWTRNYGNVKIKHTRNIATQFVPEALLATITAKKK